jgi:hypothetical protein
MVNRAKNNYGIKGYVDDSVSKIDQTQLPYINNNVDIYAEAETANNLGKFAKGLDKVADFDRLYTDGTPTPFAECSRFCRDHEIPESAKVQGNKTKGMQ